MFCAAAIFWVGLRRGWWLDLISFVLKHINKGKSPASKKKSKHKVKKKGGSVLSSSPEEEAGLAEAAQEGGAEAGGAAAAKAFFQSMKAKMQGSKGGAGGNSGRKAVSFHKIIFHSAHIVSSRSRMVGFDKISAV